MSNAKDSFNKNELDEYKRIEAVFQNIERQEAPATFSELIIDEHMPPNLQTKPIDIGINLPVPGVVWSPRYMQPCPDRLVIPRYWAREHFSTGGFLYDCSSYTSTNPQATQRDWQVFFETVNKVHQGFFVEPRTLGDFSCGTGRHVLYYAHSGKRTRHKFIGMEMVPEPRIIASQRAQQLGLTNVSFIGEDTVTLEQNKATLDYGHAAFNDSGYEFYDTVDQQRLNERISCIKSGGLFVLDKRGTQYQIEHYSEKPVVYYEQLSHPDLGEACLVMRTIKFCQDNKLGARETIYSIEGDNHMLLQDTTYGWRLYTIDEHAEMLKNAGAKLKSVVLDNYGSQEQRSRKGEREILVAQVI